MNNGSFSYVNPNFTSPLYLCCQPGYFTDGLDYKEYYVPQGNPLCGTVSMFYEASAADEEISFPVIPDGCIDVVISFNNNYCDGVSICGTISSLYYMELKDCDYIFGIRFMPGKFPLAMLGDIEEYIDEQKVLTIRSKESKLIKGLAISRSFYERIGIAANYIGVMCDVPGYKENLVSYAMERICASNGNISINSLSSELGYSNRYIERIFKEYTGFSPKSMCKVARVHRAVMMMLRRGELSRTDISMACGYSDLSHMNREIKKVLGVQTETLEFSNFYEYNVSTAGTVYRF
jgi:AraC-like DNA-binding protein